MLQKYCYLETYTLDLYCFRLQQLKTIRYKTTFCHKVAFDVQLMNFLFEAKMIFCSQDI